MCAGNALIPTSSSWPALQGRIVVVSHITNIVLEAESERFMCQELGSFWKKCCYMESKIAKRPNCLNWDKFQFQN
jgi:hypothetical protein